MFLCKKLTSIVSKLDLYDSLFETYNVTSIGCIALTFTSWSAALPGTVLITVTPLGAPQPVVVVTAVADRALVIVSPSCYYSIREPFWIPTSHTYYKKIFSLYFM